MNWEKMKSILVAIGIMIGIMLITAILVSQVFMPIVFGKGKLVEVPNLVGKDLKTANTESADNQLHISEASYVNSDQFAKGLIISQQPSPGTKIKADGTISVVISKGGELAMVPNVEGLAVTQAFSRIKNAGLKPVVKDSLQSDQVEADHILRVWPTPGSGLTPGSSVYLSISTGPGAVQPEEQKPSSE
jgi:eukaryotic-like serine/threonine-protein kinase